MAFFYTQRQRLRREEGWSATSLAQEIFSMMSPDVPMETRGPVLVSLPEGSTEAPYQIGNFSDGNTGFSITNTDGTPYGDISIDGGQWFFTEPGGQPTIMGGGGGDGSSGVPVWG